MGDVNGSVDILLVEDNLYDAELTINAFKSKNLANNLFHVEDGAEALDFLFHEGKYAHRAGNNVPSLVLLDLKMPRMNGMEVLKIVKADARTKHIPIVVLTSSNQEPDVQECYRLGVNSYIVKPVGFENFLKAVVELGLYWMVLNNPPNNG